MVEHAEPPHPPGPTPERTSANNVARERFVRLADGDMRVVEDGEPGRQAVLLISNAAVPPAVWDPVVPRLAGTHHVVRVDLLGHGSPAARAGYDIVTLAGRVGEALNVLGITQVTAIGHSSGCTVVTSLAEQRPDTVAGLALINMGPSPAAKIPERLLTRLVLTRFPGPLLWRLRTEDTIRKGARTGFTRPVDIPDTFVDHTLGMTHRALAGAMRAPLSYLGQRSLPDRLTVLGRPVLVIFGVDDRRWRSSSAEAYRRVPGARVELLPGVGHTPMMEDPQTTATLLLDFVAGVRGRTETERTS